MEPSSELKSIDAFLSQPQTDSTLLVQTYFKDTRPFEEGLELLDWRLSGAISRFVREKKISGEKSEKVYLPFSYKGRTVHLLVVGSGEKTNLPWSADEEKNFVKQIETTAKAMGFSKLVTEKKSFSFLKKQPNWSTL